MKQCYTSKKCANRGPHKVNSRSYVGQFVAPRVGPGVPAPTSDPVEVPKLSLLKKLRLKFLKIFRYVCNFLSGYFAHHRKDCQSVDRCS